MADIIAKFKVIVRSYVQYSDGELDEWEEFEEEFDNEEEAKKVMYEQAKSMGCRGMWLEAKINNTTYIWREI